jgi:hypothetical protein
MSVPILRSPSEISAQRVRDKLSRELGYHPLTVREGAAAMKKDMP